MNTHFSCNDAKKTDLVEYLEMVGFKPQKIRNNDYWYHSPLREEKTPSFKINRKLNVWFDYGIGKGGGIIEFGTLFHNCSISEFLQKLKKCFSSHQQLSSHVGLTEKDPSIRVIKVGEINIRTLQNYLAQRRIPVELARQYCRQVEYALNGNIFTAIGFKNNAGGYELRSQNFKGSASPKDVSFIDNGAKEVAVLEGFFDYLSLLKINRTDQQKLTNFLVLNSLSFLEKGRSLIEYHDTINLYLDRDNAGIKSTQKALSWGQKYIDRSDLYKDFKDLNECLVQKEERQLKQSRGLRMRL